MEVMEMQAEGICLWHEGVNLEHQLEVERGTRFSPAVPAGAPAPTQNESKLAHLLTRLFMFSEFVLWQANAHTHRTLSFQSR